MAQLKWTVKECIEHITSLTSPFDKMKKTGLAGMAEKLRQNLKNKLTRPEE